MNGELVPWRDAKVHVLTHTLHYGLGVFEGVRAYATPRGATIFRLEDHTQRLLDSGHILGMKIPYTKQQLNVAQCQVVKANGLKEGYLRPMCFLGSEQMGLRAEGLTVNVSIAAWPWPSYMDPGASERGIKVRTSSYTRHHVNITMCKAKANGNYINSFARAARSRSTAGADEALLLDAEGYVCRRQRSKMCSSSKMARRTRPNLTSCLNGVTRRTLITLSRRIGYEGSRAADHARRGLHRRRSLFHRHRGRGAADPAN